MRARRDTAPDYVFLGTVVVLLLLGVLAVFDASYARAAESRMTGHDSWYFVKRQLGFAMFGMMALFAAMYIPLETYRRFTKVFLYISIILLCAVLAPGIGKNVNGAYRWIQVGPLSFQPSEMAKIALILYLANTLDKQKTRVRYFRMGVLRHLVWVGIIAVLLMKEPDMGTMMVLVCTAFVMLFAAGAMTSHLIGLAGLGALGVMGLIIMEPYRMARFTTFLNPWEDYFGAGYQIIHSLIALGTGGLWGIGLCEGREKMYIPEPHTDMIFPTIGEEAGLIGSLIILSIFAFLTYKGISIAHRAKSSYACLLATGLTSLIAVQALINVAVVTSLVPATGVPLPFISYGGSSLVFLLTAVGIVLSVSRQVDVKLEEENDENSTHRRRYRRTYISSSKHSRSVPKRETRSRASVYR